MFDISKMAASALVIATVFAASSARADDAPPADGKHLFLTSTCVACHGKDGAKAIQTYPHLAGQDKTYLLAQMKDITEGRRVSGPDARGYPRTDAMKDVMLVVNADQMKTIADWLGTLPPAPIVAGDPAKVESGAAQYAKSGCQSCHGKDGAKPLPGYPVIAGQKKSYLALQLKEIRDGVRTNGRSKMMLSIVKSLGDEQVDNLAEFLSNVDRTAAK